MDLSSLPSSHSSFLSGRHRFQIYVPNSIHGTTIDGSPLTQSPRTKARSSVASFLYVVVVSSFVSVGVLRNGVSRVTTKRFGHVQIIYVDIHIIIGLLSTFYGNTGVLCRSSTFYPKIVSSVVLILSFLSNNGPFL